MKYLKYIIEQPDIQELVNSNKGNIDIICEDYQNYIIDMEYYIRNNLSQFISEDINSTYDNIKAFALNKSTLYFQELIDGFLRGVGELALVGISGYFSFQWIKSQLDDFWDSVNPFKKLSIDLGELSQNKEVNQLVQKAANDPIVSDESIDKIAATANNTADKIAGSVDNASDKITHAIDNHNRILINPEPTSFTDSTFFMILAITSLAFAGKKLLDKYNEIRKTSQLKESINKSFDRLISLGSTELEELKRLNQDKYLEHLNRCTDKTSPFGVLEINLNCPLDAYLTYCSSMLLSLAGVYLTKVSKSNDISKIDGMRGVLSIRDEFITNQLLTSIYNNFIEAIEFIYSEDQSIVSKWKGVIDNNIKKFISTIKQQPRPQVQDPRPPQQYVKKDNYVRPNRPNYQSH